MRLASHLETIWRTIGLLVPALIPSWRFFSSVAPSPRVEFALSTKSGTAAQDWQPFRPRPPRLSAWTYIRRLFWNPEWNEQLFLVSCAERLIVDPTEHSSREILGRIAQTLALGEPLEWGQTRLQFRLVFIRRVGNEIKSEVCYVSAIHDLIDCRLP